MLAAFQGVGFYCGKMTDALENPFNQLTCKSAVFVVIVHACMELHNHSIICVTLGLVVCTIVS